MSADAAITVDVPVVLEGEAKAVESENGVVDHVLVTLAISAKPADIPNEITVDISGLAIGDAIRAGDLTLRRRHHRRRRRGSGRHRAVRRGGRGRGDRGRRRRGRRGRRGRCGRGRRGRGGRGRRRG
ncbi:MAG: hypothetical protein R2711_16105 [Acidimicrobiales bacterium]